MFKKIKINKELNKLSDKDFSGGCGWIDEETFHCYIAIPEELQKLLDTKANVIEGEYHFDDKTFHYAVFKDKNCDEYRFPQPVIKNNHLDNLLLNRCKSGYTKGEKHEAN